MTAVRGRADIRGSLQTGLSLATPRRPTYSTPMTGIGRKLPGKCRERKFSSCHSRSIHSGSALDPFLCRTAYLSRLESQIADVTARDFVNFGRRPTSPPSANACRACVTGAHLC